MQSYFRSHLRSSIEALRSPRGNVDVPRMVAAWATTDEWAAEARRMSAGDLRGILADLGQSIWDGDIGNYRTELLWNTESLGYLWSDEERSAMLRLHCESLVASAGDAVAFGRQGDSARALSEACVTGSEHLAHAIESGRGIVLLSAYQDHPRFLMDLPTLSCAEIGVLRHDSDDATMSPLLFPDSTSNVRVLPASVRGVRSILDLLNRGQMVALYNDFVYPESTSVPAPLFGQHVPVSRGIISIIARTRALVLPVSVARADPRGERVSVEFFLPIDLMSSGFGALSSAALVMGLATECIIRRHPANWRLWNTLQARWSAARSRT